MEFRSPTDGLWAVVLCLAVAGCRADEMHQAFSTRDSSGVHIAESRVPRSHDTVSWRVAPQASIVVGTVSGQLEYAFDRIDHALRLPDGMIVVADRGSGEVRYFDEEGTFARAFGRKGDGPGEFRELRGITHSNGSILAFDAHHGRLTILDPEGNLQRTITLEGTGRSRARLSMYRLVGMLDSARIVMRADRFLWDLSRTPRRRVLSSPTLLYDLEGKRLGEIAEPMVNDIYSTPESSGAVGFTRVSSASVGGGRVFATDGGAYEVRGYRDSVRPERVFRVLLGPRELTEEDLSDWRTNGMGRFGGPHAEAKPWLRQVLVDGLGYLWALEYEQLWNLPNRWGVFDETGRWLGRVRTPERLRVTEIGTDYVIGISTDEYDVEFVAVHDLDRR